MSWPIFAIFAYLALALETGLRTLVEVSISGIGSVSPSLVLILAVFVAMWAPPLPVLWAALILGLLTDLRPLDLSEGVSGALLGPSALGYLAGAYVVLQVRALLYRDSPLALAVMVFVAGLMVHIVPVVLLWMRGWALGSPLAGWSAADEFVRRFLSLLYTAALALPIGHLLLRFQRVWSFDVKSAGYAARR